MAVTTQPRTSSSNLPFVVRANDVLDQLEVTKHGLSSDEAESRAKVYGRNELKESPREPRWRRFASQFRELVIWILIFAAVVAGLVGEWTDTIVILAIVLLNALIGFYQEERAEKAIAALQKLSAPLAKVFRDGVISQLPASEIVPGDVIELEAGDNIPADVRLIEASTFSVQEAALTGESVPVEKNAASVLTASASLGDRRNMAYFGTIVATGRAKSVVVEIGMKTELGKIAGMLESYRPDPTPLQRRLSELGKVLVFVCLAIVSIIFALETARGGNFMEVLLVSLSLAVAAVPEGLPAVVTIALALGLQRMVRRNALARRLSSVETLGAVTVICSDKTGTLTRNEMTVREIVAGGKRFRVNGTGYVPSGEFFREETGSGKENLQLDQPVDVKDEPELRQVLTIGARCNGASLVSPDNDAAWEVIGDPTEGALIVAAMKGGIRPNGENERTLFEIPFDSERKIMSVAMQTPESDPIVFTKGAPEVVLARCCSELVDGKIVPLDDRRRDAIVELNTEMASRALRVLGLAYSSSAPDHESEAETDLVFAGLVGMIDPPREEAKLAVQTCRRAGIRPVMITGDHPETAQAIARELGISDGNDCLLTGQGVDAISDDELVKTVEQVSVYARVSAGHKLRVIEAWKKKGQVVAMTGDGVNDAPAVKAADIGIAMGITGTHVTKEASDMILMDDNFTSIVSAVEEGRGIYDNIQKVVHYLLSCNAGEVLLMFFAALVGWPVPLLAIQILWINLVTDGLPALALGMEPPERDIMHRTPRPPKEPVITVRRGTTILLHGSLIVVAAVIGFWLTYSGDESRLSTARTVTFCTMSFSQLFFALGSRSHRFTMPELGVFSNPLLFAAIATSGLLQFTVVALPITQPYFDAVAISKNEWILVLLLSLGPVTIIETEKILRSAIAKLRVRSQRAVA